MISEKLSRSDPISVWIDDFLNSKDPRFAGKTRKQRRQMALGAYFGYNTESQSETKMQDTNEDLKITDSDVDALAEMLGKSLQESDSVNLGEELKSFKEFFKESQDVKPAELTKFVKQSVKKQGESKE